MCMCTRYLGECAVCVLDGRGGGREGGLCALCAFAGKDGSCLLMLGLFHPRSHRDNHGTSLICFFLVHIVLLVSVSTNPLPTPLIPLTHAHTYIPLYALRGLVGRGIVFQHLYSSAPVCLLPEASGTPGSELLLSSLLSCPPPSLCLAVMSPVSFQSYSYK